MLTHQKYFVAAVVEQELFTAKQVVVTSRKGRTKKKEALEKAFVSLQVAINTQVGNDESADQTFNFIESACEATAAFADLAMGAAFITHGGAFQRVGKRRALVLIARTEKKGKPIMPGTIVRMRRKERVAPLSLVWTLDPTSPTSLTYPTHPTPAPTE